MDNNLLNPIKSAVKNWWVSLFVGIISIIFGIWFFTTPLETLFALTILFVAGFFVSGIFEIIFAVSNRNNLSNWGWNLILGVVDIIFAIVLISNPLLAPTVLIYFIIFWLMFQSLWGIGVSIDLSKYKNSGWSWLLTIGIIGLILAVILLFQPLIAGFMISYLFSSLFVLYGIFRIILAIKLKSLHKYL